MKKTIKKIFIFIILYLLAVMAVLVFKGKEMAIAFDGTGDGLSAEDISVSFSEDNIAELTQKVLKGQKLTLTFRALQRGTTDVTVQGKTYINGLQLKVTRFGFLIDLTHGSFGGLSLILGISALFLTIMSLLMFRIFWDNKHVELYAYRTLYSISLGLFEVSVAVTGIVLFILNLISPERYGGYSICSIILAAAWQFMLISLPFILIYSISMIISNLILMKHEGKRLKNALGILTGVLLMGGWALGLVLRLRLNWNFQGSADTYRLHLIFSGGYCTIFMYFECMLLGSIICGRLAAGLRPDTDRDYVIILGCGIKKDGTLYPLIKGRVDRAIDFYKKQLKETGKAPILVPSGGQGPDEVCPEAEAMRNYLLTQGIPDEHILVENKSRTTLENMAFSRKLIEARTPDARTAFSTTDYHVFRSGLWSRRAGFHPQGMGAKSKWYFGSNAYLREVAGLMLAEKKRILLFLLIMILFYIGQVTILPV